MKEDKNNYTNNLKRVHAMITIQFILDIIIIASVLLFFALGLHRCSGNTQEDPSIITYEETTEATEQTTELSSETSTDQSTEQPTEPIQTIYEPSIYISTEQTESRLEVIELTETSDYVPDVNECDVELLAMVIYQEVGSDAVCDECRRRVADVVLNRVDSNLFPDTIEGVLTQSGQYGNYYRTGVCWPSRASYDSEAHAVERARRIAREVLEGNHSELYGNGYVFQAGFTQGSGGFWCCGVYYGRIY